MKLFKACVFVLISLMVASCHTEETEFLETQQLDVTEEMSEQPIYSMAVYLKGLSQDIEISNTDREKARRLSELMLRDLRYVYGVSEARAISDQNCFPSSPRCVNNYNVCISWAKSWDELLSRCNGPEENRPYNCDQIRVDYIKNLDKIEATYIKCSQELIKCNKLECKGGGDIGPL